MKRQQEGSVVLAPLKSRSDWETACATFAEATAFHDYDFLETVASPLKCSFMPLGIFSRGQQVGVAPLLVKKLGPFCTINWVPFPYLGPLVPRELLPGTLRALRAEARRRSALNHQQSFSVQVSDHGPSGFKASTDRTFVIPLSGRSDDDLLAAMHTTRRRDIGRAQRSGFEVGEAAADDFALMDAWLGELYAGQGMPAMYPPGTYARLFHVLRHTPGSIFSAVRLGGQTVAVQIAFSTARSAFGWQLAVDPSYRSKGPMDLLIWRALRQARDAGAAEYDLVGAPNEGIALYKSRFGAAERHYTVLNRQAKVHVIAVNAFARLQPKVAPREK
ncbi:MAG TPA: GNAT family N-acetyltransferase [Streptosporangiaceae bacterium]|nr:GNAT family N-acetyltransferase [Streptosporangiaceae bacterium]